MNFIKYQMRSQSVPSASEAYNQSRKMKRLQINRITFLKLLTFLIVSLILLHLMKKIKRSTKSTRWDNYQKALMYNVRFWELVVPSDKNTSFTTKQRQPVLFNELDNLWRPLEGQPGALDSDRIVPQLIWQMEATSSSFSKHFKTKKILIWDTFQWWSKGSWKDEAPRELLQSDCHHTPGSIGNCIFSDNESDSNSVDAIVIAAAPNSLTTNNILFPEQILTFNFILESPLHSWARLSRTNDLSAGYWRGSDIVTPYSKWVYYDLNTKFKPHGRDYTVGKTKPAAIFLSNCESWNNRMGYIQELQKSIQVDIFGFCGPLKCEHYKERDCFEMLKKDYFFYLSFENSNCRDYITEKLFTNGLQNDVIPIVMGAHPDDYKAMAPYKSYIHIEDFDNPNELVEYMNFLIKHPAKYNKYFEWKGTGEFISTELFCRFCAMVHYSEFMPPPKREKTYDWGPKQAIDEGMCLNQGIWYWTKVRTPMVNEEFIHYAFVQKKGNF